LWLEAPIQNKFCSGTGQSQFSFDPIIVCQESTAEEEDTNNNKSTDQVMN